MQNKDLEKMVEVTESLHREAVRLNRQTESYRSERAKFIIECEDDLGWLKGKIGELLAERRVPAKPQPYMIGREL